MREQCVYLALVVTTVLGLGGIASEKPPESYRKSMQTLEAFSESIGPAMTDADYDAVTRSAVSAKEAFGTVEYFWKTRKGAALAARDAADAVKSDEAAKLAWAGAKAAADLGVAASLRNSEGIAFAAQAITGLCAGCHARHREQMADGTFQIK